MDNETRKTAIKFSIYLVENWFFEGLTCQGRVYSSKSNYLNVLSIYEIYDKWIEDQK